MLNELDFKEIRITGEYLRGVPYDVSRQTLYQPKELYEGYISDDAESFARCYDSRVYQHYMGKGKRTSDAREALGRALHDHHIGVALDKFLKQHEKHLTVGVMGGHALLRTDDMYREIVLLSKLLTEKGYLMISGGGPGAMEATHLGAWMAGRIWDEAQEALQILSEAPSFHETNWLSSAFDVMSRFPQKTYESLGIPTWLYGHEPATPFATHIAKLFENSIREDNILTFAYGGIVYTPGSAGTMQEIFQEAVQNHYLSFGFSSPMVFLGRKFWTEDLPIYPLLQDLMKSGKYKNLILSLSDDANEVIDTLEEHRNSR